MYTISDIAIITGIISAVIIVIEYLWAKRFLRLMDVQIESSQRDLISETRLHEAQLAVKDERIQMLGEQIELLRSMTPEVLRKRFSDANEELIETISEKDEQVKELKTELKDKSDEIDNLTIAGEESSEKENLLNAQINELEDNLKSTESELEKLKSARLSRPELEKLEMFINETGTAFAIPLGGGEPSEDSIRIYIKPNADPFAYNKNDQPAHQTISHGDAGKS